MPTPTPPDAASGAPVAPGRGPTGLLCIGVAAAALLWMALTGLGLARRLSPTADEPGHLAAGLCSWDHGDYRLSTGNLFFTQKWAAAPLALRGVAPPGPADRRELEWNPLLVGEVLLYTPGADPRALLAPARTMTLLLCVIGGIVAAAWAARLGGPAAGAFCAVLYASCPVILANGVLVTTDTGAAVMFVAALACYGWMLENGSATAAALTGLFAALMALSKFSIVAWLFSAGLLLAWTLARGRRGRPLALLGLHVLAAAAAWACVWSFFGWQFRPGGYDYFGGLGGTWVGSVPANALGHAVGLLRSWRVLPEPVLREALSLNTIMEPRPGYLNGAFHSGGTWAFFPVAFLVKSTVGMLLALLALFAVRRPRGDAPAAPSLAPLAAGAAGFAVVALLTPLNIGVRHILPLFLLSAVAGGVALSRLSRRSALAGLAATAIACTAAAEGFEARHQPLAWFNLPSGGPMHGYRLLVDSSLDWGGDLPDLAGWLHALRSRDTRSPVYVSLAGPPGQEHFGLPVLDMTHAFEKGAVHAGYFVFGATRLMGGPHGYYGQWNEGLLRRWEDTVGGRWRAPLPGDAAALAVARLAAACRAGEPSERVGPVYFVYRLDERALEAALGPASAASPPPPGSGPQGATPAGR